MRENWWNPRTNKLQTSTYQRLFKVLAISELLEKNVIKSGAESQLKSGKKFLVMRRAVLWLDHRTGIRMVAHARSLGLAAEEGEAAVTASGSGVFAVWQAVLTWEVRNLPRLPCFWIKAVARSLCPAHNAPQMDFPTRDRNI